ncbi:MAG: DegV family protein [Bacteroidetes bacterium]|nr:DegV family protein [Bacteroidota bacterium]
MKLSRANYETFLVDYLDGKLTPLEVANLLLFLEQNPDIKEEFEGVELSALTVVSSDLFPNKEALKKKPPVTLINENNASNFLVRKIENDLSQSEIAELDAFLAQNISFRKELGLFEKTILKPDLFLQFSDRDSLKKRGRIIPLFYRISSIAALLLLLVAIPLLLRFYSGNNSDESHFASNVNDSKQRAKQFNLIGKNAVEEIVIAHTPKHFASNQDKLPHKTAKASITQQTVPQRSTLVQVDSTESRLSTISTQEQTMAAIVEKRNEAASESSAIPNVTESPITGNASTSFISIKSMAEQKIKAMSKDNLDELAAEDAKKKRKISGWDFAAIGAKLVGKVSGKKIQLQNRYNSDGQLTQYAILSNNFEFSRGH